MSARQILRASGSVLHFVFTAMVLFVSLLVGVGLVAKTFITPLRPELVSTYSVVGSTLVAFVAAMVQTYRDHPEPRFLADATADIRGLLWCILAIDLIFVIVNYCPGILPGSN